MSRPGGIKPEVKPEGFTSAGEFYEDENTPLRIPSWVEDQNDQSTLKLRALGSNSESISRDNTRISVACAAVLSNRKVSECAEET